MHIGKYIGKVMGIVAVCSILGACGAAEPAANPNEIHVSPRGSDTKGAGTEKKPFATVERARDEARTRRRAEDGPKGALTIILEAGTYPLRDGLLLTGEDSGLVFKADGDAVLTGGITLDESIRADIAPEIAARLNAEALPFIRAYDLKKLGLSESDWGKIYAYGSYSTAPKYDGDTTGRAYADLFVGGQRQTLARYPNGNEFAKTRKVLAMGENITNTDNWDGLKNPKPGTFAVRKELFARIQSWQTTEDVWMLGYFMYDWADMTTTIKSVDGENGAITPDFTSIYGYKSNAHFCFFNVLEELDAPGEWYLDRQSGVLYSYPPSGAGSAPVTLALSVNDIITVDGAENVTFDGLNLQCGRGSGINAKGDRITVKNCSVSGFSQSGVILAGSGNLVTGCELSRMGGEAISLSGGDRATLTPANSAAENNHIWSWSEIIRTYRAAVQLRGVGLRAAHNEMHDAPHLAIIYGGNDISIEYNEIYDVCYNTLDGGAIYCGRNWTEYGNVIRYNYLHEIGSSLASGYGPMAIYLDDAVGGHEIYGNIMQNCEGLAMLIGGGRDIVIKNNLFINAHKALLFDQRAWDGYFSNGWFEHMVVPQSTTLWDSLAAVPYQSELWAQKYPALAKISIDRSDPESADFPVNPAGSVIEGNVICLSPAASFEIAEKVAKYSKVGENLVLGREDDPGFVNLEKGDLNLLDSSVIFSKLPGFEKIPFDEIGRSK